MMSYRNKVIALSTALGVLVAALLLGAVFSPERRLERAESGRLLAGDAKSAASLEISGGGENLSFTKKDGAWRLTEQGGSLQAASSKLDSFLGEVAGVTRLQSHSESKAAWVDFGLDEAGGKRVVVKDGGGKVLADFVMGSYGPTGKDVYVRLGQAERVYSAASNFGSYLSSGRRGWLDLRVLDSSLRPEDIQSLAVRASIELDGAGKPARSFDWRATRDMNGWSSPSGPIGAPALEALLRGFINLEAEDAVVSAGPDAFKTIAMRAELGLGTGASKVFEVGSSAGEGRFYLRLVGRDTIFTVSSWSLKNLAKTPAELAPAK